MTKNPQRPEGRIDLHLHTCFSDGTFTPEEVVRRALKAGLSAISVTDHDTVGALPALRRAAAAIPSGGLGGDRSGGPEILSGVELTVAFRERELHVLGYGFREEDPALTGFLKEARLKRRQRIQAMIARLNARGMEVTLEEVEAAAGPGESIGRPHLAEVLVRKGAVGSLREAFERYIGDRGPCFVRQATLAVADAAGLLRRAGGVAVLAHPHRLVEDDWIPELAGLGMAGIEVYHSDHDAGVIEKYRRIAERLGLITTGGSDCHGHRRSEGPLLGTVPVPYDCLKQIQARCAGSEAGRAGNRP